jgi:toxin YoeB
LRVHFTDDGWDEYLSWATDADVSRQINCPIEDIRRDPFRGKGKPEPLKHAWAGFWSRRISKEHRLIYKVVGAGAEQYLCIFKCRDHY